MYPPYYKIKGYYSRLAADRDPRIAPGSLAVDIKIKNAEHALDSVVQYLIRHEDIEKLEILYMGKRGY